MRIDVRAARASDAEPIRTLAVDTGLIPEAEVAGFASEIEGDDESSRWLVATDPGGQVVGAAYLALEPFSDAVWNVYFMAVDPAHQGTGVGTRLLTAIHEQSAIEPAHAHGIVIETSSLDSFAATRRFYESHGYQQVGLVPDYYGPTDSKVIYWRPTPPQDGAEVR